MKGTLTPALQNWKKKQNFNDADLSSNGGGKSYPAQGGIIAPVSGRGV